jgi:TonB-dependent receptor
MNWPHKVSRASFLGLCIAATLAQAQEAAQPQAQREELEEVVVTGFRQSLENSTVAKKDAVGFVDAVFAEDIGKFPDTNIAESFQRIPGIQISREISGEGTTVAIRGLNTNFTRVLLNNAPVAVAQAPQEGSGGNREVPLDMFPPELFSKLEVFKTPTANMVEGGAAGTINMRMARPFDNEGQHLTYSLQGTDNSNADDLGGRTTLIGSRTWDTFGVLAGVSAVRNKVATTGFESVGWSSLGLSQAMCGAGQPCNTTGGNLGSTQSSIIPGTVPRNATTIGAGLISADPTVAAPTIDQAWLLANNPGLTIQQIDNAVMPRLGRTMFEEGDRDRLNTVVSLEFRPNDDLHFFLDSMYGKQDSDFTRQATAWTVRSGSQGGRIVPTQMQVDRSDCSNGCTLTSGVFPNAQFMMEFRPYTEESEFWGTNPGMTWQLADKLSLDVQANYTTSEFHREASTVLFISDTTTVNYSNSGDKPTIASSVNLNDPNSWQWLVTDPGVNAQDVGRVNLSVEDRETETTGGRFALTWGDSAFSVSAGGAYDEVSRDIRPRGADAQWQAQVCGGSPANLQLAPNSQPICRGDTAAQIAPQFGTTNYPGYAGPYAGSLITNSAVPNYLRPTGYGVATVNWDQFRRDSNYDAVLAAAPQSGQTPSTAQWGSIDEDIMALFTQVNGDLDIADMRLRYNVGVRYVETDQLITSRVVQPNASAPDGQRLPDSVSIVPSESTYENWLPSANVSWNVIEPLIVRAGLSRTMTRPNPSDMLGGVSMPNNDAAQVVFGNPELDPYVSDNIDLGVEYYTGNEGYVGVAAFRKGIDGFTQTLIQTALFSDMAQFGITFDSLNANQQRSIMDRGGPTVATVQTRKIINASGRLTVKGLELNWVQPLDFLLEGIGLDGLGFAANYTFIDQKGKGAAPAIAIGVPDESYNGTLYYEKNGVSARVSVTHSQGSQASGPNSNQSSVTGAELFGDDYTQYDFSSSFDFSEMFGWSEMIPQLTVDVVNLSDEARRSYQQFSNATYSYFESGRVVMVGLRGRFD